MNKTQQIPAEWKVMNFNEFIELFYGSNLPKTKREHGSIPVYGSNGITDYHSKPLVKGPGLIVGRKGSIGLVHWSDKDFWPIDTTYYVKESENKNLKWIYYKLQTLGLEKMNTASGIPGLNRNEVYSLKIAIPPLPEQTKIAAILSKVDEEIEKVEKIIEQTEKFKKGLMQKLLTKGIGHTKFKQTELGEIPVEWEVVKIKDICSVKGGKRLPKGDKLLNENTGFPYIRVTDFNSLSVDLSNIKYLSPEIQEKIKRYTISKDDVFISIAGTIGIVGIVPDELHDANLTENAAKIVIHSKNVIKNYILYYLSSAKGQKQIKNLTIQTSQPKLGLNKIEEIIVGLPTLYEQKEIVNVLLTIDNKISINQNIKSQLLKLKKGLMADLLNGKVRV